MADATTVHAWMVAQARRRAAGPALARQPAWPAAVPSTRLGLSHPQTHPAVASTTICPSVRPDDEPAVDAVAEDLRRRVAVEGVERMPVVGHLRPPVRSHGLAEGAHDPGDVLDDHRPLGD